VTLQVMKPKILTKYMWYVGWVRA